MSTSLRLIDIHNHLVPGVDDGSEDIDMSLRLIDQGIEEGIGTWITTPHVMGSFTAEIDELHQAAFQTLVEAVEKRGIPAELHLGSEIMFQDDVETVKSRRTATFANNGRYFLMEFPIALFPPHAEEVLYRFQRARMTPIIAHVERYADLIEREDVLAGMVDRGILTQVNARSIMKDAPSHLRHTAERLILTGAAHFVASDGHHPDTRPVELREAYEHVVELAGEDTAERLFIENPRKAITGESISTFRPEVPERAGWLRRLIDRFTG